MHQSHQQSGSGSPAATDGMAGVRRTPAAAPPQRAAGWVRPVATLIMTLYLVLLVGGWISNIPAGHEGFGDGYPSPDIPGGIVLAGVEPGSPVDQAGVRAGDVVLSLNGVPATDHEAIHQIQHERRAGQPMTLRLQRAAPAADGVGYGPPEEVTVTLVSQLGIASIVLHHLVASVVGLLIMTVALVVVLHAPHDLPARLLLLFGGCFAFVVAMDMVHWGLPLASIANLADIASIVALGVGCAALLHLFLVFPVPKPFLTRLSAPGPARPRKIGGLLLVYGAPLAIPVALVTGLTSDFSLVFFNFSALLVAALVALVHSYWRSSTPLVHAQLKWIALGFLIFVTAFVLEAIVPATTGGRVQVLPPLVYLIALALFPLSLGLAILRYRLWDIDIIINRALVYAALTGALLAVYFGGVVLLGGLFRALTGQESNLAIVVSTLVSAALFQPLRRRLQAFVDRRFYRRRYDAARTLAAFSASLRDEVDLDRLSDDLIRVVDEAMQPSRVSLWLRPPDWPARRPSE